MTERFVIPEGPVDVPAIVRAEVMEALNALAPWFVANARFPEAAPEPDWRCGETERADPFVPHQARMCVRPKGHLGFHERSDGTHWENPTPSAAPEQDVIQLHPYKPDGSVDHTVKCPDCGITHAESSPHNCFECLVALECDSMERPKRKVCVYGCFAVEGEQAIHPENNCPMHTVPTPSAAPEPSEAALNALAERREEERRVVEVMSDLAHAFSISDISREWRCKRRFSMYGGEDESVAGARSEAERRKPGLMGAWLDQNTGHLHNVQFITPAERAFLRALASGIVADEDHLRRLGWLPAPAFSGIRDAARRVMEAQ